VPSGARNPIDSFIQTRLAKEGLNPSPEADRRTLLLRVTLDLSARRRRVSALAVWCYAGQPAAAQ